MNEEALINPRREKGEREIPGVGILCINPGDALFMTKRAEELGGKRHFLFNSKLVVVPPEGHHKGFFIAGPTVGAPMAAMTLEKLVALGTKKIVVCGWCGSLSPEILTGEVLLPTWGLSEEGTSRIIHLKVNRKVVKNFGITCVLYFTTTTYPAMKVPFGPLTPFIVKQRER